MGRKLDVPIENIEKIGDDFRLKRRQIRSWTGCSENNERHGRLPYLLTMIWLSGAWL